MTPLSGCLRLSCTGALLSGHRQWLAAPSHVTLAQRFLLVAHTTPRALLLPASRLPINPLALQDSASMPAKKGDGFLQP